MIITANLLAILSVAGAWNIPSNPRGRLRIDYQTNFIHPVSKTRRSRLWTTNRPDPPNDEPPPPDDDILRGDDVDTELSAEQKAIKEFGVNFSKTYVAPVFSGEIVQNVPLDIIKGALVSGASVPFIVGKGILLAGVTGLGVAYVALTPGPTGDSARVVGKATWSSTQALIDLSKRYDVSGKIGMFLKAVVPAVNRAISDERFQSLTDKAINARLGEEAAEKNTTIDSEITKMVKEAEDAALSVQIMLDEQKADEINNVEDEDEGEDKSEDKGEDEDKDKDEGGGEGEDEDEDEIESNLGKDDPVEKLQKSLEQDAENDFEVDLDGLSKTIENDLDPKTIENLEDKSDDLSSEPELSMEEQYIGEDDWDASVQLAEMLSSELLIDNETGNETDNETDNEIDDAIDDEIDNEDDELSISFETGIANEEDLDAARELAESLMDQSEDTLSEPDMTLEELGKAARAAVEQFEREQQEKEINANKEEVTSISTSDLEVSQDYENLTVVKLKDILRSRGLKVSGRKADLITRLMESE